MAYWSTPGGPLGGYLAGEVEAAAISWERKSAATLSLDTQPIAEQRNPQGYRVRQFGKDGEEVTMKSDIHEWSHVWSR